MGNMPAFVPILLMLILIGIFIGGLWWQDHGSGLWRNEYIERPDGTASGPFSEILELTKMVGVVIILALIVLGAHLLTTG